MIEAPTFHLAFFVSEERDRKEDRRQKLRTHSKADEGARAAEGMWECSGGHDIDNHLIRRYAAVVTKCQGTCS